MKKEIDKLKKKTIEIPKWEKLVTEYDPAQHEIMTDLVTRKDRVRKDGVDRVARITYGKQKLSVNLIAQLAFTIPVKRVCNPDGEKQKAQLEAIEAVYKKARIDNVNLKRFKAYFGACEVATIWYVEKKPNKDYGFDSDFKLRCVSYSPMEEKFSRIEQAEIYPIFDENANLTALSFESEHQEDDQPIRVFESYTAKEKKVYRMVKSKWVEEKQETPVPIGKIQGIYAYRPLPIWEGTTNNIREIEYTRSRQSDILKRNTAPVMRVVGELVNPTDVPTSDQAREVFQLKEGGSVDYVKPPVDHLATNAHIESLKESIDEELQLPDLSIENVKSFGASGVAREHLLTSAHLKIGDEQGDIIEFLDRECSVIKAFLKKMNPEWSDIDDLEIDHKITPFVMRDEERDVETLVKATGKPIMSQRTAIQRLGWVEDEDEELALIRADEETDRQNDLFNPTV